MHGEGVDHDATRRSVYLKFIRNKREALVDTFDGADGFNSVAHRMSTTTAPQALLLMNGDWIHERVRALLNLVLLDAGQAPVETKISIAYKKVLARSPAPDELRDAQNLMATSESINEGLYDLCHLLLNSNEFLYVE